MTSIEEPAGGVTIRCNALTKHKTRNGTPPTPDGGGPNCHFADGRIVLSGSVSSFYLKKMAQTLTDSAIMVDNQLEEECAVSTDLEIIGGKTFSPGFEWRRI